MAKAASKQNINAPEENEQLSESYISIGLGLLVVVVVGILLYNYFTQRNASNQPSPSGTQLTEEATMSAKPGSTYTVVEGDTLWSISEKSYGTGYNWEAIAKENNLSNSDQLVAGQQLKIPEVSPAPAASAVAGATPVVAASPIAMAASPSPVVSPTAAPSATPVATVVPSPVAVVSPVPAASPVVGGAPVAPITGTSYTIVRGDTLWDIACRAYNDCYAWTKIAEANKLTNPSLIHADNVLTLPR